MSAPVSPPALGFVEWFRPDEQVRVEQTIVGLQSAGITRLRTHLSWAEFHGPGGQEWYDWLLPKLGSAFELLPCVHYTPPSLSRTGASSGAPKRLQDYADFVDLVLTRYGTHFREIELWNEPNNLLDWDWREDSDWLLFSEMVGAAAFWVQQRGWRAVLAAPSPFDRNWLELMGERGVLGVVSAVGFHAFPGTWDSEESVWHGYADHAAEVRGILDRYNPQAEVWITEAGYSTWRGDEAEQVRRFEEARNAPVDRLYWYGWQDIARDIPVQEGLYFDPRHYHLGATDAVGRPKLLRRLLEKGETAPWLTQPAATMEARRRGIRPVRPKPHLILGGAGFIGANLAETLLSEGEAVTILDNLGRAGVEQNLAWLKSRHGARIDIRPGDVRDGALVGELMADAQAVYHFAAQVAVTDSLVDPLHDFSVNALGTVTVLEALRKHAPDIPLVFASTNKVYGSLEDVATEARDRRQTPLDRDLAQRGIDETRPLQFRTPYGCSKGAADQYVLDYAHSYGLRTAVLRMSCIYGPRQFGTEDQGWVAHFLIRALRGEPITLFGDGTQVRDVLHVRDAVAAYRSVIGQIDGLAGQAFNLGGGPRNAVCLLEVLDAIAALTGRDIPLAHAPLRSGDQPWFVADTGALEAATGWAPTLGWQDGLADLHAWAAETFATESIPPATESHRMKVALVNPPWSFEGSIYFGCREPHLPLELGYAKALLEGAGHQVLLLDGHLNAQDIPILVAEVAAFAPEMTVVTTAPSYLFWRCAPPELRVPAAFLQALGAAGGTTVAVGPHGSVTPGATLRKLGCDIVVRGECEEIVLALAQGGDRRLVPSIAYLESEDLRVTGGPAASAFVDAPALHWPADWVARHHHHHHRFDESRRGFGAEVEASRGCPYNCSFCAKIDFRDAYRRRKLEPVLEEIDALIAQGVGYIYFIDEIFLPQRPLLEALVERDVVFGIQTRIDLWKPDLLALLGRAGCVSIEAGLESLTVEGRAALAKRCRLGTEELADLLIEARRHVPFVQANLIGMEQDDAALVAHWRDVLLRQGVWANEPVPLYPYPSSPSYRELWGAPDDQAWERAHAHYLAAFSAFSDIQDERPVPLAQLEASCCAHH